MKGNNAIWNKKNSEGFTLVEVIVSMTLLVIVAGILLTGVMASGSINSRSTDLTNEGYNQALKLEEDSKNVSGTTNKSIIVSAGVKSINVAGYLISRKDDDNSGVAFTMFVPEPITPAPPNGGGDPSGIFIGGNPKYAISPIFTLSKEYFFDNADDGELEIAQRTIFHLNGSYYITKDDETEFKPRGNVNTDHQFNNEVDRYITNQRDDQDKPNAVMIKMEFDPDNPNLELSPTNSFPVGMELGSVVKVITKGNEVKLFVCFPEDLDGWKKEWRETFNDSHWKKDWAKALEKDELAKLLKDFFVELKFHDES